jgi:hypothetical protein
VKQLLGDVCVFDHMEVGSFTQENTKIFSFYASMFNTDFMPRSKMVTVFHERVCHSDVNNGPPLVVVPLSPGGRELVILIHLDHYFDWSTQPKHAPSSSMSGPPSSSDSSASAQFPVFRSFS